jgi:hypothetical protein
MGQHIIHASARFELFTSEVIDSQQPRAKLMVMQESIANDRHEHYDNAELRALQRVRDQVLSRQLRVGQTVKLIHFGDVGGRIVRVSAEPTRFPVVVERDDGESFAYGPDDLEVVNPPAGA